MTDTFYDIQVTANTFYEFAWKERQSVNWLIKNGGGEERHGEELVVSIHEDTQGRRANGCVFGFCLFFFFGARGKSGDGWR